MPLISHAKAASHASALISTLASFGPLRPDDAVRIEARLGAVTTYPAQADLDVRRAADAGVFWSVAAGWAGTLILMPDGRRQVVDLLLPGDTLEAAAIVRLGLTLHAFTVVRLQEATELARDLSAEEPAALNRAWREMQAAAAARCVRHLSRLGGMMAYERVADLLLELHERERRSGLATSGAVLMPLTQDALADYLGLSNVHINRVLQQLRRDGLIDYGHGRVIIRQLDALEASVGGARSSEPIPRRWPG